MENDERSHPVSAPDSFAELADVLDYLTRTGWQVARSTLFNHQKEGKIRKDTKKGNHPGRFPLEKVEKYAKKYLKRSDGTNLLDNLGRLQERKLIAEVREREAKAKKAEMEVLADEKKLIPREDMERELVARALVLDSSFRHMIKTGVPEWIELAGGDPVKEGQVMDEILAALDRVMNDFASTSDFVVELICDEEEPAD